MRTLVLVLSLHLGAGDHWLGEDKVQHFFVSALLECVSYSALRSAGARHDAALAGASAVAVGVGVAKEWHDRRAGGEFSARDLTWDLAGAATGALLLGRTK
jgi:putative lipoprotein